MASPSISLGYSLPRAQRRADEKTRKSLNAHVESCAKAVDELGSSGDWPLAIRIAVERARLTPAAIATELGVMRSTVSRWMDGTMAPHERSLPDLRKKLVAAIRKTAA